MGAINFVGNWEVVHGTIDLAMYHMVQSLLAKVLGTAAVSSIALTDIAYAAHSHS